MSPREMATGASGRSPTTSVRDGHHRVDLDLRAAGKRSHPDGHPGRRIRFEERLVHLVDRAERTHLGRVDREPHGVAEARTGSGAYRRQVLQAPSGLVPHGAGYQLAGSRVDRDLTRTEEQVAAADRVDVGTDGLRGVRGVDRLAARCHRLKRIPRISAGVAWTDGQPSGPGELALPPAARGEPG